MKNRCTYTLVASLFFVLTLFELSIPSLAVLNISLLIFSLYSLSKLQKSSFTPFNIVLACIFLFHCGHLWLNFLDSDVKKWEFLFSYSASDLLQRQIYTYVTQLIICFYLVGVYKLKPIESDIKDSFRFSSTSVFFNFVFCICFFLCIYYDIQRAIAVASVGYGLGFTHDSGFSFLLSAFLNGLFIFMFLVNRNNKKVLNILIAMVLLRTYIVMFLVGNRGGTVVFAILVFFILAKYTIYREIFSKKSVMALMVLSMTIFLPLISLTRTDTIQVDSITDFVIKYNPLSYFFAEFGSTIKTVILAFQYNIPEFSNGKQFFYTTLPIIPGSDLLIGSVYIDYVSIGSKLNHLASIRGLGGSIIANVYINFGVGVLSFIAMTALSYLNCLFSNKLTSNKLSIYKFLLYCSMFAGFLTAVRGEWYDFITQVKTMLYLIILLWCCSKFGVKLYK